MLIFKERADQDVKYQNQIKKAAKTFRKMGNATPDIVYKLLKKDYPDADDKWLRDLSNEK